MFTTRSRIEGVTKYYSVTICITQDTYDEVSNHFLVRELDKIRVVGKREPISIFQLLCTKEERNSISEEKWQAYDHYAKGLEKYRSKQFSHALQEFELANQIGDDPTSRVMKKRVEELIETPPPSDWDGIYDMRSK